MSYFVYILYSKKTDKYYVGSTQDVELRLSQHNASKNKSTKAGVPWQLMKVEVFESRKEATNSELFIKRMKSRKFTEQVIKGER